MKRLQLRLSDAEFAHLGRYARHVERTKTAVLRDLVAGLVVPDDPPLPGIPPTRARAHSAGARVGSEFSSNQGQNEGEIAQNPLVLRPITKKEPS